MVFINEGLRDKTYNSNPRTAGYLMQKIKQLF